MPTPDTKTQTAPALAKDVPEHDPPRPPVSLRSSSAWWSPPSPACRSGIWCGANRCWCRARWTRRGSTSRRASMAASPRSRWCAARTFAAGAVLVRIDNPETIAKHEQALAAKVVAEAQLANINVGTRVGGHRRAQGRARAGAGERGAGAEDLRPRQTAGRAGNAPHSAARPGDRRPA